MASLVDVNVLVALLHARHCHSPQAVQWLDGQTERKSVLVCRVAQMEALRLLTRLPMMKEDVLSAAEFWQGWSQLMADDRFLIVKEPDGFEAVWQDVTRALPKGQCAKTDAYLAALARSGGWCLVTFDRDFRRFRNLQTEILS